MKRLLVIAAVAVALLLALRHPASPPAIASVTSAPPQHARHFRKGHTPPTVSDGSLALVYVAGAVVHSGLYRLKSGSRVNDAVQLAGGFRADADPAATDLADRVTDGEEIHVVRVGESAPHTARRTRRKAASYSASAPAVALDLNAVDAQALASVPGIGPTLASRIVEYRRLNGPFGSLDELADVAGMTQRRIDALASYVTVNGSQ